ncbi:MAG: hypothetical protein J0I40_05815 [Cellulomonas sp.]|nr:hypothetical protein [Cellulomonas sp.]
MLDRAYSFSLGGDIDRGALGHELVEAEGEQWSACRPVDSARARQEGGSDRRLTGTGAAPGDLGQRLTGSLNRLWFGAHEDRGVGFGRQPECVLDP